MSLLIAFVVGFFVGVYKARVVAFFVDAFKKQG